MIGKLDLNIKTFHNIIDKFKVKIPVVSPSKINLICDATFFRKRKDKDGLLIFYDSVSDKVLWFKFIESEKKEHYLEGLNFLLKNSFEILSVTTDGRRGIASVFSKYPVQVCQFHVQKRVSTLLTKNPRTEAGKELRQINNLFIQNRLTEKELGRTLALFCKRNSNFLIERNDEGNYKHDRIIQALRCYKRNMKYLFTYQEYKNLNIPNTTNHIDGGINPKLKELVRIHRGMRIDRRNKLLVNLLCNLRGE